ncbi:MAG: pentapeptide repeat-containing protein [Thermodesulfobacteriota bacterium]
MPPCKYHEICGRDALGGPGEDDLCILHSQSEGKDKTAFWEAFEEHRKQHGDKFSYFVFPEEINFHDFRFTKASFKGATFIEGAVFTEARFSAGVDFTEAEFQKEANFGRAQIGGEAVFDEARFGEEANFWRARFSGGGRFYRAKFFGEAIFWLAEFTRTTQFWETQFIGGAHFVHTKFCRDADFRESKFSNRADFLAAEFGAKAHFEAAEFEGETYFQRTRFTDSTDFTEVRFTGRTLFTNEIDGNWIFADSTVDFRRVILNPLDAVTFKDADLRKSRFLGTDLRKAEITGAKWPEIEWSPEGRCRKIKWLLGWVTGKTGRRIGVYDEIAPLEEDQSRQWAHIELLYRQLKQNYEDRRDYERGGAFHFGEKEMRLSNKQETRRELRWVLGVYRCVSGYGESFRRPLVWAVVLLVLSTIGYLLLGLGPKGGGTALTCGCVWDWLRAAHYSLKVMTLLKPDDLVPIGWAKPINTLQSLLGPVLIGLFALALRQGLRR